MHGLRLEMELVLLLGITGVPQKHDPSPPHVQEAKTCKSHQCRKSFAGHDRKHGKKILYPLINYRKPRTYSEKEAMNVPLAATTSNMSHKQPDSFAMAQTGDDNT